MWRWQGEVGKRQRGFVGVSAGASRGVRVGAGRVFGRQRPIYASIEQANWPHITVFIAAHNEESVISGCIEALLDVDYPRDRLTIMPANDPSTDGTRHIIDSYAGQNPGRRGARRIRHPV